jgi:hypothetical protein
MLGEKSIGLIIFMVLNGLGVVFLLYVLVQFWQEGHKSMRATRPTTEPSARGPESRVVAMTASMTVEIPRENGLLIRFPIQEESGHRCGDEKVKHAIR